MKALTLTAPYGTLIAIAARRPDLGKHIETRSWSTTYRGPLAIHQAQGLGPVGGKRGLRSLCCSEPFISALRAGGIDMDRVDIDALPLGAIVATCELVDCVPTWADWATKEPYFIGERGDETWAVPPAGSERAFGDYTPGRYAWLLASIQALPEPIPCKGALSLWEPDTLTQMAIKRQQIRAVVI